MRDNICKPWKWQCVGQLCPGVISRVQQIFGKLRWEKTKAFLNKVQSFSKTELAPSNINIPTMQHTNPRNTTGTIGDQSLGGDLKITVDAPSLMRQISNQSK